MEERSRQLDSGGEFLWDAATAAQVHERLVTHDGGAAAVAFSPDGRTLPFHAPPGCRVADNLHVSFQTPEFAH